MGGFTLGGIGGATALMIAASQPWAWIYLFVPLVIIGIVVAVAGMRSWTSKVEGAMERALDAIAEGPPVATDSVADVISDIRDTFSRPSRTSRSQQRRTLDL